jgi:hypothetical protein
MRKRKNRKRIITRPIASQESIGVSLAQFIADRHDRIVSEWEEAVRRDQAVPIADELTHHQLRNHIPKILSGLSQTLCDASNQELAQDTAYDAAMHGQIRWEQHYDISQLLREIGHLRVTLIHHLTEFHEQTPDFCGASGLFATVVVHSYFDRLIRVSVEQFLAAGERKADE